MEKLSRSLSDRMRRNSFTGVSVGLDIWELENFVLQLSTLSEDPEMATVAREHFAGLAARIHAQQQAADDDTNNSSNSGALLLVVLDELNEVVNMLGAILSSAPHLPSKVVAQVHSFVGLIRSRQNRPVCAIQSFLKALWLQTAAVKETHQHQQNHNHHQYSHNRLSRQHHNQQQQHQQFNQNNEQQQASLLQLQRFQQSALNNQVPSLLEIAITENRLGLAYGMSGNLPQAISLLEKSLEDYEKAKMKMEHMCIVGAQTALSEFRTRHLNQLLHHGAKKKATKTQKTRRLSHIQEDREFQIERRMSRW